MMSVEWDWNDLEGEFREWFEKGASRGASDLHLIADNPPMLRCFGKLLPIEESTLSESRIRTALKPIVTEERLNRIAKEKNCDLAIAVRFQGETIRLRMNLFLSYGKLGACIRFIPDQIPSFAWSSFPEEVAKRLIDFPHGLILFAGITGAGKSTSLAMIIQRLNRRGGCRIITIEDPIEYRFPLCPTSLVTQREIGTDVETFYDGLKYGLRQDPDVILVGEIRDQETAKMALSAAETGHLVFSTLHTRDAKGAISRYADFFPQSVQNEIRSQLASSLRAVICQRLIEGMTPFEKQELALEILFNNAPIAAAIRMGKLESVDNYILTGRSDGMVTMDESLRRLVAAGLVRKEVADLWMVDRP
jgi:twitching motility protein PilT